MQPSQLKLDLFNLLRGIGLQLIDVDDFGVGGLVLFVAFGLVLDLNLNVRKYRCLSGHKSRNLAINLCHLPRHRLLVLHPQIELAVQSRHVDEVFVHHIHQASVKTLLKVSLAPFVVGCHIKLGKVTVWVNLIFIFFGAVLTGLVS